MASSQKPCSRSFPEHVREPSSWVIRGWAAVPSQLGVSWGRCISARGWQKWSQDPAPSPGIPGARFKALLPSQLFCDVLSVFWRKKKWPLHAVLLETRLLSSRPAPPCPLAGAVCTDHFESQGHLVLCSPFFSVLVGFVHLCVVCLCLCIQSKDQSPLDFSIPVWDIKKKKKKKSGFLTSALNVRSPLGWTQDSWLGAQGAEEWNLVEVGLERCLVGGAEGLITLLGVTLGPGWGPGSGRGGMESGGSSPAQQCPRHAWMSGGREAEKQEPQL